MSDPQKELGKLAQEQGWRVERVGHRRLALLSPDGQHRVVISEEAGERRAYLNSVAQLRRAGLDIPHANQKPKEKEPMNNDDTAPTDSGPSLEAVSNALDAAVEMVTELAEHFTTFRKATTETLVELRGSVRALQSAKAITPEQVQQVVREFDARLQAMDEHIDRRFDTLAQRVDPIGAFRQKLRQ